MAEPGGSMGPRVPEETQSKGFQSGVPKPAASASPGSLLEVQSYWLQMVWRLCGVESSAPGKGLATGVSCRNWMWRTGKADARVDRRPLGKWELTRERARADPTGAPNTEMHWEKASQLQPPVHLFQAVFGTADSITVKQFGLFFGFDYSQIRERERSQ